ncbi:MAG: hypothetical protein O9326_16255 [Microcystis sp. LE19-338.1B]|jgi:hypothetical protein|nr:hypothetical protein [Microcystis sp. LE19-338.1B]MCZ8359411.1 hypothetical protein [Microcystis sp. LE19-388.1G]
MSDADFIREVEELYLRLANADTYDLVELAKIAGLDPKTDLADSVWVPWNAAAQERANKLALAHPDPSFGELIRQNTLAIEKKIIIIQADIHRKRGIFLRSHIYTIDELLKHEQLGKIHSLGEKLYTDIQSWNMEGKLTDRDREVYKDFKERYDKMLKELLGEICDRQKTIWEQIKGPIIAHIPHPKCHNVSKEEDA